MVRIGVVEGQQHGMGRKGNPGVQCTEQFLHFNDVIVFAEIVELFLEKGHIQALDFRIAGVLQVPYIMVHDNGAGGIHLCRI